MARPASCVHVRRLPHAWLLFPGPQKSKHGFRVSVRLLDIGNVGGVERGELCTWDMVLDVLVRLEWGCRIMLAGDDQRRRLDLRSRWSMSRTASPQAI